MQKYKKAGMLIVLLALPAFFFLFLKLFGTNHYDLPYFHPVTDSAGQVRLNGADTVYYSIEGPLGLDYQGDTVFADLLEGQVTFFLIPDRSPGETVRRKEAEARFIGKFGGPDNVLFVGRKKKDDHPDAFPETVRWVDDTAGSIPGWGEILKTDIPGLRTFSKDISLVLVDGKRHIRGYYDLSDQDEFDRAVAEGRILLYQKEIARN